MPVGIVCRDPRGVESGQQDRNIAREGGIYLGDGFSREEMSDEVRPEPRPGAFRDITDHLRCALSPEPIERPVLQDPRSAAPGRGPRMGVAFDDMAVGSYEYFP